MSGMGSYGLVRVGMEYFNQLDDVADGYPSSMTSCCRCWNCHSHSSFLVAETLRAPRTSFNDSCLHPCIYPFFPSETSFHSHALNSRPIPILHPMHVPLVNDNRTDLHCLYLLYNCAISQP